MKSKKSNFFRLDGQTPVLNAFPLGIQHVLAMFLANMAPIAIIAGVAQMDAQHKAILIQNCMFVASIATIIQLYPIWRIGARLPVVMGTSFTFVAVICGVCNKFNYPAALGAVLVGGIFEGMLGLCVKNWRRVVTPIVSATVVTSIGFSLFPIGIFSFCGGVGAPDFCSWTNLLLGTISLLMCLCCFMFAKGIVRLFSVLVGMIAGFAVALVIGKASIGNLFANGVVAFPHALPFPFEFHLGAIISVGIIFLVSATETIGDTSALVSTVLKRDATNREFSGAIGCDGFASALASLFGCSPVTSFSQNVGLICMTKVINRFTIFIGISVLLLASFLPPIGVFFSAVPNSVLGGCTMLLFGFIAVAGFEMISKCGFSRRNVIICALSLVFGFGFTSSTVQPLWQKLPAIVSQVFASNEVAIVFLISIVLNLVLPKKMKR